MGTYLSNLQIRIRGPNDREKIEWAIRSAMDAEPIRAGATLRSSKTLPEFLTPSPIRTISIAPADPGVNWIAVYDDEADLPGQQLTKMAQELSTFLERPIVAISLAGSSLYAGLVDDGEIWDSIARPLDELEEAEDDADSYRGDEETWAERLGVDADRLREAWDGEHLGGENRLFALSDALAMNHERSGMGAKYLVRREQCPSDFRWKHVEAGLSHDEVEKLWEAQIPPPPRPVDEPGFTVLRFRWTAPGWAPEP